MTDPDEDNNLAHAVRMFEEELKASGLSLDRVARDLPHHFNNIWNSERDWATCLAIVNFIDDINKVLP